MLEETVLYGSSKKVGEEEGERERERSYTWSGRGLLALVELL
jgi:hypothetical protein